MLTSKLILIIFTWGMALLVSISLRIGGIVYPQPLYANNYLVWAMVFGPSFCLLSYFLVKRSFLDFLN